MDKGKNYYVILGVSRDATPAAIRKAYRRLARQCHPDTDPGSSAEAFRELQAAYETLKDAERRRRYDECLWQRERDRPEQVSWAFVRGPATADLRRPLQPRHVSGEILLTSDEAVAGGILPIDLPVLASCPACEGTGGFAFDCDHCWGEGKVERRLPVPVRIPAGVRDGTVFQIAVDDPGVSSVLLTIHVRPY